MECTSENWCAGDAADRPVLEIRVHGVNNTAPDVMLDTDASRMCRVSKPDVTSFWRVTPGEEDCAHVPTDIRREAYSWGGLVRPRQDRRTQRWWAMLRLAFQILALPFRIGNVAIWTRSLSMPGTTGAARVLAGATAGAARLFGLLLTLLFATTAGIVTIDFAALQCFAAGAACALVPSSSTPWMTSGLALALGSLGPIAAVSLLTFFAKRSRERYDRLGERDDALGLRAALSMEAAKQHGPTAAEDRGEAIIAHAAFWSNRITAHLARVHLAAAIALTSVVVALHSIDASADAAITALIVASGVLLLSAAAAVAFPTMTITPTDKDGGRLPETISWILVVASVAVYGALFVWLVAAAPAIGGGGPRFAASWLTFVLTAGAAVIAATGLFWRWDSDRQTVAWRGTGPGVFMALSLGLAVVTSAATVTVGGLVLRFDREILIAAIQGEWAPFWSWMLDAPGELEAPLAFVYTGGLCAVAIVLVAIGVLFRRWLPPRRSFEGRLPDANGPGIGDDLARKIDAARRGATVFQSVEYIALVLGALFGAAIVVGLTAALAPLLQFSTRGLDWLPYAAVLSAGVGVALAAFVFFSTLFRPSSSFVAIVWDVACFLPRTAQPFGPPCYAELAVPELTDRISCWLRDDPARRVVLSAHSMGAVIAVASLGMLRHETDAAGHPLLPRITFLTYGVQLRTYFGRILPELLGPRVLGVFPARMPSPWRRSPWHNDDVSERRGWTAPQTAHSIEGTLVPAPGVRWLNLWRLTDYLGFPAFAGWRQFTVPTAGAASPERTLKNEIDRYAEEHLGDPATVVTHSDYVRGKAYRDALEALTSGPSEPT